MGWVFSIVIHGIKPCLNAYHTDDVNYLQQSKIYFFLYFDVTSFSHTSSAKHQLNLIMNFGFISWHGMSHDCSINCDRIVHYMEFLLFILC